MALRIRSGKVVFVMTMPASIYGQTSSHAREGGVRCQCCLEQPFFQLSNGYVWVDRAVLFLVT